MCESGINVAQLKLAVGQSDDALAMVQQWLEQLHHLADHGKRADVSAALAQARVCSARPAASSMRPSATSRAAARDDTTVELI